MGRYVRDLLAGLAEFGEGGWRVGALVPRGAAARSLPPGVAPIPWQQPPGPATFWSRLLGPRALRRHGAALYHATFLAPLAVPREIPMTATIHDLIPLEHPRRFTFPQRAVFRFSLAACAGAERVVAVSEATARKIAGRFGLPRERLRVVPPPVSLAALGEKALREARRAPLPVKLRERYLLHLGGFDPLKGVVELLLPAFAQLRREGHRVQLVMTGDASAGRARVERVAAELGLQTSAVFAGQVSDEARLPLIAQAAAVVVPSFEEGFGLPALEALACGVPVAVGPAEATREAVGAYGILARAPTPQALAQAMAEALAAHPAESDAGEARRRYARRFAPVEVARRLVQVWEEVAR